MLNFSRSNLRFLIFVLRRFDKDGCFYRAGALTYTTILSLVPLMAVSFAVLAAFPAFQDLGNQLQSLIIKQFVATSAEVVEQYLHVFVTQAYHFSLVGLFFLAVTAVTMIYSVEETFNSIWEVHQPRRKILALLFYWVILLSAPLLVGLGLAASAYLMSVTWIARSTEYLGISPLLLTFMSFLLTAIAFSALYIVIPNCKVPVRNGVIAGMSAAAMFELAKHAFGFYVTTFPTYQLLYGTLAAIPIFFVWIYVCWVILLLGVEICYALTHFKAQRS